MAGPRVARCSGCQAALPADAFLCPHCELIQESSSWEDLPEPAHEPSVIRSLLSIQPASGRREKPRPPPLPTDATAAPSASAMAAPDEGGGEDRATVLMGSLASPGEVPSLVAELDLKTASMSPFEAFVVSMMDGRANAGDLQVMCGVSMPELAVVLRSLADRKIIRLETPPAPAPRPRPAPAAAAPPAAFGKEPSSFSSRNTAPQAPAPITFGNPAPAAVAVPAPAPATLPPAPAPPAAFGREPPSFSRRLVPLDTPASARPPSSTRMPAVTPPPAAPSPAPSRITGTRMPAVAPRSAYAEPIYAGRQESHLQKALLLESQGKLAEALAVLDKALSGTRDAAPLYNRLGLVLLREKRDFQRASRCFERASRLDPQNQTYSRNHMQVVAMEASFTGMRENPFLKGR